MADELSAPLGRKKPPKRRFGLSLTRPYSDGGVPYGRILAGIVGLIVIGIAARLILVNDPLGGRPVTEVAISSSRDSNQVAQDIAVPDSNAQMIVGDEFPAAAGTGDVAGTATADTGSADNSAPGTAAIARTLNDFGAYPDLLEQTQQGAIPRIGANGERPFTAYSRPSVSPASAGAPLVAIVVTGLGLNESSTLDAVTKLPDNITLAFAPYGRTLQRTAGAAQAQGHEIWLEIPMEPFDYPDSDPGPETLLTGQPVRTNLDKLYWLMSRFGGYAGVINNLGARFTSAATDFEPVMEEIGTRGLGYIDDGSSNRSLAKQLSNANQVPFTRADLELDASPNRAAIISALDDLVARAQASGSAVGVISALPVSIDTLAAWAGDLDGKGVELVPASALMKGEDS